MCHDGVVERRIEPLITVIMAKLILNAWQRAGTSIGPTIVN